MEEKQKTEVIPRDIPGVLLACFALFVIGSFFKYDIPMLWALCNTGVIIGLLIVFGYVVQWWMNY